MGRARDVSLHFHRKPSSLNGLIWVEDASDILQWTNTVQEGIQSVSHVLSKLNMLSIYHDLLSGDRKFLDEPLVNLERLNIFVLYVSRIFTLYFAMSADF